MKILLTGGGTGGHFYPIIAIAESLNQIAREEKLLELKLYYMAPTPYNKRALLDNNLVFVQNRAGKVRRYFSLLNIFDIFKTGWGIMTAVFQVFSIFPDVIFGKGGYASFPALVAGKLFKIPVIIHESDSAPGRVNTWAAKFATRIAISYPEAAHFFPADKVALTGNPIRKEILVPTKDGAYDFFKLETGIPIVLILGGSQGAEIINETVLQALPALLSEYQIIHQTGEIHITELQKTAQVILTDTTIRNRYHPVGYFDNVSLKMAAGVANLVISRAGSSIFEIAAWSLPSIIIPIPESISHDQRKNAFTYARSGAALVIEESNLSPHVFVAEIQRLFADQKTLATMKACATQFARVDAADTIAKEIIRIGLAHEK